MRITWDAKQVADAREEASGLVAVGIQVDATQEAVSGKLTTELCFKLMAFVRILLRTGDPAEAFRTAWPEIPLRRHYAKSESDRRRGQLDAEQSDAASASDSRDQL